MVDVIGILSGLIAIFQFGAEFFGSGEATAAVFRIAVGLEGDGLTNAGGGISEIRIYGKFLDLLGSAMGGGIGDGGYADFAVKQINDQQAVNFNLVGADDAVCIAYITAKLPNLGEYGWVGTWGCACGVDWYWSNVYLKPQTEPVACTWVDKDHSNGLAIGSLGIHWPALGGKDPSEIDRDPASYCNKEPMMFWESDGGALVPVRPGTGGGCEPSRKLALRGRNRWTGNQVWNATRSTDNRLVISHIESHSAITLCEAPNSRGPSFVSLVEGYYCNMATRELLPLCSEHTTVDCFHLPKTEAETHAEVSVRSITPKEFSRVIIW